MKLANHIIEVIKIIDKEHILTEEQVDLMSKSLTGFIFAASTKFIAGQKEHKGDIRDRNLFAEMANEQIDLFWYGPCGCLGWPKKEEIKRSNHD